MHDYPALSHPHVFVLQVRLVLGRSGERGEGRGGRSQQQQVAGWGSALQSS